jgi:hypothetical protein
MKTKLIYSNYDSETGVSTAIVANKYGKFRGFSFLSPEDRPIASSYAGCRYAELKAIRKSVKAERKEKKAQLVILKRVYNELAQLSNFEDNSMEIRKIRKNIYMLEKEIKNLNEKEEKITQYLLDSMQTRDKILKKIKSK